MCIRDSHTPGAVGGLLAQGVGAVEAGGGGSLGGGGGGGGGGGFFFFFAKIWFGGPPGRFGLNMSFFYKDFKKNFSKLDGTSFNWLNIQNPLE